MHIYLMPRFEDLLDGVSKATYMSYKGKQSEFAWLVAFEIL